MNEQPMIVAERASTLLNEWRMRMSISVNRAAELLETPEEEYVSYEIGQRDLPFNLYRRCKQLEVNPHSKANFSLPRDRWVAVVEMASRINAGEPVIGDLLRHGKWAELKDMMDFAQLGPAPQLALTDPKLFVSLREAATKIYLTGIMEFPQPKPPFENLPKPRELREPVKVVTAG
jgi:hypothetical protein